jgi:hypothetical protein
MQMSASKKRIIVAAALFVSLIAAISIAGTVTKFRLDLQEAAFWDVSIKAVGGFVAIAGVLLTLTKYLDDKDAIQRKPFADLRANVYSRLVQATALIGNNDPDSKVRCEAEQTFWVLFWGELPMIVDGRVGGIVNEFHSAISDNRNDQVMLRNLSMKLARACRASLGFDQLN